MYITELSFEVYRDTSMGDVEKAVNYVLDCLRYNGQVLGRELPVSMDGAIFTARVVCPESNSLHPDFHSPQVKHAMDILADSGSVHYTHLTLPTNREVEVLVGN